MNALEIIVIILSSLIVFGVMVSFAYKKIKGEDTSECASCRKRGAKLIKKFHKKYSK